MTDYIEPMDIYARPGTKVSYMGKNGRGYDRKYAEESLTYGDTYTVESTEVHSWSSTVTLVEVPGKKFNTVMFREV